uniref:Uncharacterized protein n=1 Tax=Daphnia magna TaxID=35525 RepID=A0A0N8CSA4_9CRUS
MGHLHLFTNRSFPVHSCTKMQSCWNLISFGEEYDTPAVNHFYCCLSRPCSILSCTTVTTHPTWAHLSSVK